MDTSALDLASYREQVAAIDEALKVDPENAELVSVRTELLELISLTEAVLQQSGVSAAEENTAVSSSAEASSPASASTSTPRALAAASASPLSASASPVSPARPSTTTVSTSATVGTTTAASRPVFEEFLPQHQRQDRVWAAGDKCRALYEGDGKFYEATILAVGQTGEVFTVEFKGYESSPPSLVRKQDLKPSHEHHGHHKKRKPESGAEAAVPSEGASDNSTGATTAATPTGAGGRATAAGGGGAPKKKKVTKTAEEAQEQVQKQNAWKNFAAKGKKTGVLGKKSMFATPDNPHGKVGVVGSGKGMTQFQQRGKHVYNANE